MYSRPSCRIRGLTLPAISCLAAFALWGSAAFGSAAASTSPASADSVPRTRFAAVAFDYFVLFNPDSVVAEVDRIFPGKGRAFTDIWRTRQFEYAWLRSMTGRYADFFAIAEDSLVYAANALHLQLSPQDRRRLLD